MPNYLPSKGFSYDKDVAINYAALLAKDIIRLDMPGSIGEFDFSSNDAYPVINKKGRKFVFVSFLSKKNDGFFLIVLEVCGFDGLGIQRYSYADFGAHASDPTEFKKDMENSQDDDLDIPVGCPGWYTQQNFEQP